MFSDCYDMEDDYYEDYEDSHYYFPRRRETFTDLTGILWDHNKATPTFQCKLAVNPNLTGQGETYEVYSVPQRIQKMIRQFQASYNTTAEPGRHVLVKRAAFPPGHSAVSLIHSSSLVKEIKTNISGLTSIKDHLTMHGTPVLSPRLERVKEKVKRAADEPLEIETGLFMDAASYKLYSNYFRRAGVQQVDRRIIHLMLAFVNSIQAIYNFPSLGRQVGNSIKRKSAWHRYKFLGRLHHHPP